MGMGGGCICVSLCVCVHLHVCASLLCACWGWGVWVGGGGGACETLFCIEVLECTSKFQEGRSLLHEISLLFEKHSSGYIPEFDIYQNNTKKFSSVIASSTILHCI